MRFHCSSLSQNRFLRTIPIPFQKTNQNRIVDPEKLMSSDPSLASRPNGRTAIYDIAAHAVYLPNDDKLEAHSGLGSSLDDPRYVGLKNRGPTPPNVYTLTFRDQPFHGVRAIRLIPLDGSKMFGRDGMLAHSYLRGPT